MASITETGFGGGFYIGFIFTLFIVLIAWLAIKLADLETTFKNEHQYNCSKFRIYLGRAVIDHGVKCWLSIPALYLIKIHKHVYIRVVYDFTNKRFEYNDQVYTDIDTLIGQIKTDHPHKEPNPEGKVDAANDE